MKKKVVGLMLCFIFIIGVVFGTLYAVDHQRMKNNEPVVFSTWGKQYVPPEVEQNGYPLENDENKHCFMAEILDETTQYMMVKPIVVFKSDDIHIPEGAEEKLKVEYGTDHYDYLYGIGRKVVICYEGEPYEDSNGIITIKTEDISTEGYRDFTMEIKPSDDKIKRQIVERTLPTDSSDGWWIYGDAALYYYGIEQVEVTTQGWSGPLDAWLERGIITLDGIIAKCNQDVADGVIEEIVYKDGGSQVYKYPEYTIIKYHTLDGNRDVYIGSTDMDIHIADK